jgi:outer membrane biosynthesis protein TonB
MNTAKNIAGVLLILVLTALVLVVLILGVDKVLETNSVDPVQCGMWYCVTPEVLACPAIVEEQPTATSTAVLCETPVVPTATPTHGTPPSVTRTLDPTNHPKPSSTPELISTPEITNTPEPTSTDVSPEPTKTPKPKCNKGEGNGGEGCDPGGNPDGGNDDED